MAATKRLEKRDLFPARDGKRASGFSVKRGVGIDKNPIGPGAVEAFNEVGTSVPHIATRHYKAGRAVGQNGCARVTGAVSARDHHGDRDDPREKAAEKSDDEIQAGGKQQRGSVTLLPVRDQVQGHRPSAGVKLSKG